MTDKLLPGTGPPGYDPVDESESLFERFPWLYAICRDHLFRDDTKLIAHALWPAGVPPDACELLEVGCGPGFYARRLGATFKRLRVTGIDRSERLLHHARTLAMESGLSNCSFERGDARALPAPDASLDAVIASRLFIILPERQQALAEMHRVLKPGGRCFIAEPRSALRATVPLRAMWLLAGLSAMLGRPAPLAYREPGKVYIMTPGEFGTLIGFQPWAVAHRWQDTWYQYAVCEKGVG